MKIGPCTFGKTLFAALLLPATMISAQEMKEISLWPNGAPGSEGKTDKEVVITSKSGEQSVYRVHNPSITPYLPAKDKATGAAVIVIPGGGHRVLAITHEGYNVAKWLSDRGIAAFVLKYRLARETNSTYQIEGHALPDTQRAIRLVRSRAQEWGIDPARVGVIGFSAGGELAWLASQKFDDGMADAKDAVDKQGCKPAFQGLIYPGSSRTIIPTKDTPPAFLACGYGDRPDISEGLANVYLLFKKAGVPAELHIFAGAGHGFGLRDSNRSPAGKWADRFQDWLADRKFLDKH